MLERTTKGPAFKTSHFDSAALERDNKGVNRLFLLTRTTTLLIFLTMSLAGHSASIKVEDDEVPVYSGPSKGFRAVRTLPSNTELPVSPELISNKNGEFFKVYLDDGTDKREGYISTETNTQLIQSFEDIEVDEYKTFSLSESAVDFSTEFFRQETFGWSIGYKKYPAPGFFYRGFGGQILKIDSGGYLFGIEGGNDAIIKGPYSGFLSAAFGSLFPSEDDQPFAGAKSGLNIYMRGAMGVKFTPSHKASFSVGVSQTAVLNSNNSFLTLGVFSALEIGL